ncbi:BrnT family toxin [Bartonella gliris]|uniref:BrnT family toxin n=1 Tax=Bartonella gliris TaxID=3004109 RepID=UPI003873451F
MKIRFEWDETKAKSNLRKHRVSFELAARVFADPFAMVKQDRIENGEYRCKLWGLWMAFYCCS